MVRLGGSIMALPLTVQAVGVSSATEYYAHKRHEYTQSTPRDGMHADKDLRRRLDIDTYVQARTSIPQPDNYTKGPEEATLRTSWISVSRELSHMFF